MTGAHLPPERRPNLLGIGAAKAGTTWLAGVLSTHPDIFVPPQKELNALHYGDLDARLPEYAIYFAGAEAARIRGDFSVRYLNSERAPGAAARHASDARILMVARDPVDQIQSHYWHLLRQNFHQRDPVLPHPTLFEALERFPDLLLEPALYGKHLSRWLEIFPRERFLILRFDDLVADREATLARVCDFLEVPRRDFSTAAAAISRTEARGGVRPRQGIPGRVYPHLYAAAQPGLRLMKRALGVRRTAAVQRALRLRQIGERLFFRPGYERLDEPDRARLLEVVRADIRLLSKQTGIDTTAWLDAT